jgi:hypothetical protein
MWTTTGSTKYGKIRRTRERERDQYVSIFFTNTENELPMFLGKE